MVIDPAVFVAKSNTVASGGFRHEGASFKDILASKKASKISEPPVISDGQKPSLPSFNTVVESVINNHELATKSVRASMVRTNYTPEQLLGLQYKTGMLFMAEQMFCKTAELSANTFKNFTQMQV